MRLVDINLDGINKVGRLNVHFVKTESFLRILNMYPRRKYIDFIFLVFFFFLIVTLNFYYDK